MTKKWQELYGTQSPHPFRGFVVVDLDGTLANIDHRLHYVQRERKDFDSFYKEQYRDQMNGWCRALILGANAVGAKVIIVSARPKSMFLQTAQWLIENGIPQGSLDLYLLRGENDYTPDHDLKRSWLHSKCVNKEDILFVVDDRQRVVDMWRSEGLVCLQAYAWEEFNAKEN